MILGHLFILQKLLIEFLKILARRLVLFGFSCKPFLPRILVLIFLLSIMSKSIWRKGLVSWLTVNAAFPSSVRKGGETFRSLLVTYYPLLIAFYSLIFTRYSLPLVFTRYSLLFTRYSLLCTPCYILFILCYLLGTHYVLFIQYCIIFTMFPLNYTSVPEKENISPNGCFSLVDQYCLPWCRLDLFR